jgi:pimeloyl-ACP methyl ester carboxylesterase
MDDLADASQELGVPFRESMIPTNGIELHVVEAGPANGVPVILLHGFPEYWYGLRNQAAALARHGFHAVIPDQRGYNLSDKPDDPSDYALSVLQADILGLADHFGWDSFRLVGHDWGGEVAWHLAIEHPDRVAKLAIFNAPNPLAWNDLETRPSEDDAGSYRDFFRLPIVPEYVVRLNQWKALTDALQGTARPGTFSEQELEHYRGAWARLHAIHGMINWYRARYDRLDPKLRVSVPTRIVWGARDPYFPIEMAKLSIGRCDEGELVMLPGASHWLLHEEPARTSESLIAFFRPADEP